MQQKFIAGLGIKAHNDRSEFFHELPLSTVNKRSIEISSKRDANGTLWTTKVTASLRHDVALLHKPCIIGVRCRDRFYILGTEDLPCHPTVKEGDLVGLTIELKTKYPPKPINKVLSIAPDCV